MNTKTKSERRIEYKTVFFLLFLIINLIFTNSSAASGSSQENIIPEGWNFGADRTSFKAGADYKVAQHGESCATIESIVDNPANFCTIMQNMIAKDLGGKRIKMTGFIKSQGISDIGTMWVRVDDYSNNITADFDNMMDRPVTGNSDWTRCEIIFDVPEKCGIYFGFIFKGSGKIWVDNVSFEPVDNSVPKTAQNINQPLPEEYINQLKNYSGELPEKPPVNLDFENFMLPMSSVLKKSNLPKIDLHVHLNYAANSLGNEAADAYRRASELSGKMGVTFGIAEEFGSDDKATNDSLLLDRIELAKKNKMYLGLQVSRRDWYKIFSKESLEKVDYVLADAMVFPNKDGRILYIWVPGIPLGEPQEFMDLYVAHTLEVLSEPISIWGNPTYLPDIFASKYNELWTDARIKSVINAAVKNNVAIEINSRFKLPNARFIKMAKAAGAHFTFGTNQHEVGISEIGWSINMAEECGLTKEDFFIPKRILSGS
jgi:hypothetical protein